MLSFLIWFLGPAVLAFHIFVCIASFAAVLQEQKIWAHPKLPSLNAFGLFKVFLFNVVWMEICALGSIGTVLTCFLKGDFGLKQSRPTAHDLVESGCAKFISKLFVCHPVQVKGLEHLPPPDLKPAPVYVANHHSQIDAAVCYYLQRQWRWIAKSSIVYLPGVGQIMWLGDHVFIDRVKKGNKTKTGTRNLYTKSNESIQEGVPMMFFPQGTRRLGERLPFKDGAFNVAMQNNSLLVPFSIHIPLTAWNSSYPLGPAPEPVVLTVHKPIESKGQELEALKKQCFDAIYSVLPDHSKES